MSKIIILTFSFLFKFLHTRAHDRVTIQPVAHGACVGCAVHAAGVDTGWRWGEGGEGEGGERADEGEENSS